MINISRAMLSFANLETIELHYSAKETIYERGAGAQFVYVVDQGALFRLSGDSRSITEFLFQGDGFGFEIDRSHRDTVQTLSATTLLAARREAVLSAAATDRRFANALFKLAARDVIFAEQQANRLRSMIATERVAQFLLEMDSRLSGSRTIELPMRRQHIADHLGLTLETVSRVLNRFRKNGVIECMDAQRRQIIIRDRRGLQKLTSDASGFVYWDQRRRRKTAPAVSPPRLASEEAFR